MSHEEDRSGARRRATISDVAARAGVSPAAVSVVLNEARGNVRVSEETRARITAAAAALGYLPDSAAQGLRRRRSGLIGLIHRGDRWSFPEAGVSYRFGDHMARAAARLGFHIVDAAPARAVESVVGQPIELLVSRRVEGVVVENPAEGDVERLVARGLPVVQVLRPQPEAPASTLTVDPRPGFEAALEHLAGLGHRRIGFIGNAGEHPIDVARVRAFLAALAAVGLTPAEGTVQLRPDNRLETGFEAAGALLALPDPPTALVAAAESAALGVLRRLYAAGLRVPDQVSVVSYDGVAGASLYPPVTSIAQPLEALAARAVELVAERADGRVERDRTVHVALPAEFVMRESTGPPPDGAARPSGPSQV